MTESVAVLVIFFILLAIGLIFYGNIQRTQVGQEHEEILDKSAVELAQEFTALPELQCTVDGIVQENCFDMYKAMAFSQQIQDEAFFLPYRRQFGNTKATLAIKYPFEEDIILYDTSIEQARTSISTYLPMQILNSSVGTDKIFAFGYLNITIYNP